MWREQGDGAFGLHPSVTLPLCLSFLWGLLYWFGQKVHLGFSVKLLFFGQPNTLGLKHQMRSLFIRLWKRWWKERIEWLCWKHPWRSSRLDQVYRRGNWGIARGWLRIPLTSPPSSSPCNCLVKSLPLSLSCPWTLTLQSELKPESLLVFSSSNGISFTK